GEARALGLKQVLQILGRFLEPVAVELSSMMLDRPGHLEQDFFRDHGRSGGEQTQLGHGDSSGNRKKSGTKSINPACSGLKEPTSRRACYSRRVRRSRRRCNWFALARLDHPNLEVDLR